MVLLPVTVVNLALKIQSQALVLALSNLKETWKASWFSLNVSLVWKQLLSPLSSLGDI